jgi:hypothetical protein
LIIYLLRDRGRDAKRPAGVDRGFHRCRIGEYDIFSHQIPDVILNGLFAGEAESMRIGDGEGQKELRAGNTLGTRLVMGC